MPDLFTNSQQKDQSAALIFARCMKFVPSTTKAILHMYDVHVLSLGVDLFTNEIDDTQIYIAYSPLVVVYNNY